MTDYTKNLKPIKLNGFFCHECDKALEPNDKICVYAAYHDTKLSNRFVVIDDDLNNYAPDFEDGASPNYVRTSKSFYVVDRYSLAVYLYVYDGGNASGVDFIPLFNKDGAILTYDGTLPE